MMGLKPKITAKIRQGNESGYVAECVEIAVVTQANTLDEVVNHLKEAVSLHLEGEDPREFGLVEKPILSIITDSDSLTIITLYEPNDQEWINYRWRKL